MPKSGDIRDSHLGGRALFESWKQKFLTQFYSEDIKSMMKAALVENFNNAPPEQLRILEEQNPQVFKQMLEFINGGKL